jgi:hypothetical protein
VAKGSVWLNVRGATAGGLLVGGVPVCAAGGRVWFWLENACGRPAIRATAAAAATGGPADQ